MKLMISALLMTVLSVSALAHEEIPGVIAISKATELAVHRIERLVTLRRIDPSFRNNLVSLRAERSTENGATYKVNAAIEANANGQQSVVTLWQDNEGKTLTHSVASVPLPASPFVWPEKDAASLMEEGLHFVLEGWTQHPEVRAFYLGLQTILLSPVRDSQGNLVAQFRVTSDDDARTLTINLKPDGTFLSHEIR